MKVMTLAWVLIGAALCTSGCPAMAERPSEPAPKAPEPPSGPEQPSAGERPQAPSGPAGDLDIVFSPGFTTNIGWIQLPELLPTQLLGAPGARVLQADTGPFFAQALAQAPLGQTSLVLDAAALCSDGLRGEVARARPERLLLAVRGGLDARVVACLRRLEVPRLYLAGCPYRPHRASETCDGDAELAALLADDDVRARVRGLALSLTPAAASRLGELANLEVLALVPGAARPGATGGTAPLFDLFPLGALSQLRFLDVRELGGQVVVDSRLLARLHTLRWSAELSGPLMPDCALRRVASSRLTERDLEALGPCKQLEELTTDAARFTSAAPLARWTGLRRLQLRHWRATDLAPLAALTALEQLSIPSNDATGFDVIAHLPALRSIDLSQTALVDLGPLRGLAALERLDVGFTEVSDLSPLQGLPLVTLELHNTRVRDLRPLATLTKLQELSLSASDVRDLAPLADHPALSWVSVRETAVTDVSPLLTLRALTRAHIGGLSLPPAQVRALRERLGHGLDGVGPGSP